MSEDRLLRAAWRRIVNARLGPSTRGNLEVVALCKYPLQKPVVTRAFAKHP